MLENKYLRDECLKQRIMIEKLKEEITHLKNQIQLTLVLQHTKLTADPSKSITHQHSMQPQSTSQLARGLNNKARRVSIKFGDIVQEEVDTIVNSANVHLLHNTGVATAIDKASGGVVQTESRKIIHMKNIVPTGEAVATVTGGALKCKHVIHAVGPVANHQKDQCGLLLKNACISAMNVAHNFEAISIAFPPISSGNCGVPADLVANVMLSTLCSYTCSNPTLLSDVRIVIIDKPTFEAFLNVFHREQENLEHAYNDAIIKVDVTEPVIYHSEEEYVPSPVPGHVQPVLYSHGEKKEETVLNDYAVVNISSGYDSSVDTVFTNSAHKPTSENVNSRLQST